MKKLLAILICFTSLNAFATERTLEEQLESLKMPTNKVPGAISSEKLYSVQARFNPLTKKHEVTIAGAKDFATDGHLTTNQLGLNYRYHFNDKWALTANFAKVFNELNQSGEVLLQEKKLVSDTDYLISQYDVGAEYNLFYGKFRLAMDQVFYFDQYVGLSAGVVDMRRGLSAVGALDLGLAFWSGKKFSTRVGLKNNLFQAMNGIGETSLIRNTVGYVSFGYLFGKEG